MPIFNKFYNGLGQSKYDLTRFPEMENCDVYTELGSLRCPPLLIDDAELSDSAVTLSIATPCVMTNVSIIILDGTPVYFTTTGALPTGLQTGRVYYIVNGSGGNYNLSETRGGAAINTSGSQSGVHSLYVSMNGDTGQSRAMFWGYDPSLQANYLFSQADGGDIWQRNDVTGEVLWKGYNDQGPFAGVKWFGPPSSGYFYYCNSQTAKVGRGKSTSWDSDYATCSVAPGVAAKFLELNDTLYFGGDATGSYKIDKVDSAGNVTVNALDLPTDRWLKALSFTSNSLIACAWHQGDGLTTDIYLWDTVSASWGSKFTLPVTRVVDIFNDGDDIFVLGVKQNQGSTGLLAWELYVFNGVNSSRIFRYEPGTSFSIGNRMEGYNFTVVSGIPVFAIGQQIYAIYKGIGEYAYSLVPLYKCPNAYYFRAIHSVTSRLYYSTDTTTGAQSYDSGSGTTKATAKIVTPEITGQYSMVKVHYDSLPANTTIGIETKVDGGSWTAQTVTVDTTHKYVYFDGGMGTTNFVQARITLNPYTTSTPVIKAIEII